MRILKEQLLDNYQSLVFTFRISLILFILQITLFSCLVFKFYLRIALNMFGSLKKKFANVLQESARLSETLHQQYVQRVNSSSTTPDTVRLSGESLSSHFLKDDDIPRDINLAAGCNVLAKYEDVWEIIHKSNDENALKADEIAAQIERIEHRLHKQHATLTHIMNCLSGVPALVETLKASKQTLQHITELNAEAEKRLEDLEDLVEECDLQELMLQKQCELSAHKQLKMSELESFRQRIASEHQQRIRQHEQNLRRLQKERQAVFDDAFRSDLEEYKQKGTLPKIQKQPSKELALEEVVLEDTLTKDALENFLSE